MFGDLQIDRRLARVFPEEVAKDGIRSSRTAQLGNGLPANDPIVGSVSLDPARSDKI